MHPKHALIVYDCDDCIYSTHDRFYLELHNINKDGVLEAGKPVSINFIQSLVDNITFPDLYGNSKIVRCFCTHTRLND